RRLRGWKLLRKLDGPDNLPEHGFFACSVHELPPQLAMRELVESVKLFPLSELPVQAAIAEVLTGLNVRGVVRDHDAEPPMRWWDGLRGWVRKGTALAASAGRETSRTNAPCPGVRHRRRRSRRYQDCNGAAPA